MNNYEGGQPIWLSCNNNLKRLTIATDPIRGAGQKKTTFLADNGLAPPPPLLRPKIM